MWRALFFLALLCLAAYGAVWLANHPETVSLTWGGQEYTVSLTVAVLGFLAALLVVGALLWFLRALVTLPATASRASRRRRHERGQTAITRGIVAVGAGDLAAARRYAAEAERLLGHQPLALLLKAQSAQAAGDRDAADAAFREMAARPDTRVLGLRGLFLEARRREDHDTAREYAEEAARIAPAVAWANDAVIEARSQDGDWRSAVQTIERRTSLGLVDRSTGRRQRAVLHAADALGRQDSDPDGALTAAREAVRLAPDLVPAAALAGRLLSRKGELRKAAKIIETAWSHAPHPDLAAAYLNLRPGDSALDRLRRAETLARLSSWDGESRLAIARSAIEAREFGRARETLRPLLDDERPTVRVCTAMAEIEGKSGNAGGAREWLARATRAPRGKAWIADGFVSDTWAPVSPVTGRLDAFRWETPPDLVGGPSGTGELGLDATVFEPAAEPEAAPLPGLTAPLTVGGSEAVGTGPGTGTSTEELDAAPSGPVEVRSDPAASPDPALAAAMAEPEALRLESGSAADRPSSALLPGPDPDETAAASGEDRRQRFRVRV